MIYGLGPVRVGQVLGDESLLPGHEPGQLRQSILKMKVVPDREEDWKRLEGACQELALEDPLLDVEFIPELKEISLHLMGMIQTEILQEELLERLSRSKHQGSKMARLRRECALLEAWERKLREGAWPE
jgi:ribosomal protection tetracycline resistance protein